MKLFWAHILCAELNTQQALKKFIKKHCQLLHLFILFYLFYFIDLLFQQVYNSTIGNIVNDTRQKHFN